jgi:hypothetical protein
MACSGPALSFQPLAPGLWWLPGAPGDAQPDNAGQVSNIVIGVEKHRLWVLGSGPTPAFGRRLACALQQQWGRAVTDVVSPWPHPELVLGVAGLGAIRHWAHAEVAAAMRTRCPSCIERLLEQLGPEQAGGLQRLAVHLPQRLFRGRQGQLGPWRWWLLSRGPGSPVTVWQWQNEAVVVAHGLLWTDSAPDARSADIAALINATRELAALPYPRPAPAAPPAQHRRRPLQASALRWLGEQGPPAAEQPQQHLRYWQQLVQDVRAAQERGELETAAAAPPLGLPMGDARHALNWQRAWRQLEGASFQRSLR